MTNPLLTELNNLSPGAKAALAQAHGQAMQQAPPKLMTDPSAQQLPAAVGYGASPSMGGPATPPPTPANIAAPSANSAGPSLPSATPARVQAPKGTSAGDQQERARLLSTGSGIHQIQNPFLKGLAETGNVIGHFAAPGLMTAIPGTEEHHASLLGQNAKQIGLDQAIQKGDLGNAQEQALTRETNDRANDLESPPNKFQPLNTATGQFNYDPKTGKATPLVGDNGEQLEAPDKQTPESVHVLPDGNVVSISKDKDGKPQATVVYHGDPAVQTDVAKLQIGGQEHTVLVNKKTGETVKDLGPTGEKPPVVNVNANAGREFQQQERGRGLLDKAEAAYRTAKQSANTMLDMVAQADAGNKMSAQMLPLEGALQITTAQGVHRINRTEVDQYQGAGNLFDHIAGELGKVREGQPIPPNIRGDIRKLVLAQQRQAYSTYKSAYDSAVKRYGLTNEDALPEPEGGQDSSSGKGVSLKAAMQLPINKGKTADQVRKDIQSHGHQVTD